MWNISKFVCEQTVSGIQTKIIKHFLIWTREEEGAFVFYSKDYLAHLLASLCVQWKYNKLFTQHTILRIVRESTDTNSL